MVNLSLGFLVGLLLGSLIDCLANRSLTKKSFWGRSYCDSCKKQLKWYDLFPIISYLVLKGQCRYCHKKISAEVLVVEVLSGIVTALIFYKTLTPSFFLVSPSNISSFFIGLLALGLRLYIFCILAIFVITDYKKGIIPDRISLPAIITVTVWSFMLVLLNIIFLFLFLKSSYLGNLLLPPHTDYLYRHSLLIFSPFVQSFLAAFGIGAFFALLILITRGRGMGGGDLKLGIFIGFALGFPSSILAIFVSFILGSVAGIALLLSRKKQFGQTIPFGPFLSMGALIALLWGDEIISWYFKFRTF
jgi:leader peptidase (prepilin peptidase) / N-methyltransferase